MWADGWSTKCQLIGPEGNCTHITRPQEEEEQEATPWLGGQRRIARMVFPECNQSLGKLEGCWNYTPPLTGCARLRAVTHSSKECNLCVCLLTQALCSKPQEGHAPPPSQFQFPIKVNTVWKCSHTLAQYDWSWFEFSRLIKDRVWECSLFCSYTQMIRGASRFMARHMLTSEELETHGAVGTHKNNTGITSTERADIHSEAHMSTWL